MDASLAHLDKSRQAALLNMGISPEAYHKHCSRFISIYSNSAEEIGRLLSLGMTGDAAVYAHSIKGLAATLGFTDLSLAAAVLESALKSGASCSGELHDYAAALETLPKE